MSSINYIQYTNGKSTTHKITWNIPDFLLFLDNNTNKELRPDECILDDNKNSKNFKLKILFCGQNNDLVEFYFLSKTSVHMCSKLTIEKRINNNLRRYSQQINQRVNEGTNAFAIKTNTEYQTFHANKWQYITTLYNFESVSEDKKLVNDALSHDGRLDLCFEFAVVNSVRPIEPIYVEDNQFKYNFEYLFISGLYSDIIMKSADDVEYNVHKAVLASRSAVLKAHFEHNTIECQTNIVSSPLDSDVLKEVLTFIYSDKAPRVNEMPEKLLAAGDYYQLGKMKNLASKALYKTLTVDNAIEALQLADLHSVPNLKKSILEYIKNQYASSVTGTEGWAKLNSVELTKTLYEYITRC